MCFSDEKDKNSVWQSGAHHTTSAVNMQLEHNLAVLSTVPSIFMQTNDLNEVVIRAVFDSGSQNSYILKSVVAQRGYKRLGKQELVHLFFGGAKSEVTTHANYLIRVSTFDGSYLCSSQALDQDSICVDVPTVIQGSLLKELDRQNIKLSGVCSEEKQWQLKINGH